MLRLVVICDGCWAEAPRQDMNALYPVSPRGFADAHGWTLDQWGKDRCPECKANQDRRTA